MDKFKVDTFVPEIGTVRECKDCGALIAGGPTRCIRCAKKGPPKASRWKIFLFWLRLKPRAKLTWLKASVRNGALRRH